MTTEAKATVWPVDFDALEKGQTIDGSILAKGWGLNLSLTADSDKFKLKMLSLVDEINRRCERMGLISEFVHGNVHILSDNEYANRQNKLVKTARNKVARAVRQPSPDLEKLTSEELAAWDASDRYAQRCAAKMLEAKREQKVLERALAGHKRPTLRS